MTQDKKRIFITGMAGFIGFHLAQSLNARGDLVIGCDHFGAYYSPALKEARAERLQALGIPVLRIDICDREALEKAVLDFSPTHIVHLAAQAGVRYSLHHPQAYVKSNLEGFVNVLELCRAIPKVTLLFASSSSVYGLNQKIPFCETDPTDHPTSLYGATKKANEALAFSYHHLYGIPMTGLRFFTVYGPWGRPDMAYFDFTKRILEEEPITLYNAGHMSRDFTYIDDLIPGVMAAIDLGASYEIFNLGNNRPESVLTLVSIIETLLGKKAKVSLAPMQPGDVLKTWADISKSQKKLHFAPTTSLEVGMRHFVEWMSRDTLESVGCMQPLFLNRPS